jgi:hypothetical protein
VILRSVRSARRICCSATMQKSVHIVDGLSRVFMRVEALRPAFAEAVR